MSDYNFPMPPVWLLKLIAAFTAIGVLAVLGSIVFGGVWLFQHLEFKP